MRVSAASSNLLEVGFQEHLLRSLVGFEEAMRRLLIRKSENDQAFITIKNIKVS